MHVIHFMDEIENLLSEARKGRILGLGYALVTDSRSVQAGLAGMLAKDRLKAAGILLSAAAKSAEDMAE